MIKVLHFLRCFTDDCGAYYYLKKLEKGLFQYSIKQYYLAYENLDAYKEKAAAEGVSTIHDVDLNAFMQQINPDIIHFHDNYSHYIFAGLTDHKKFYDLCRAKIQIRTIHDYSQAICPNYLHENHGDCNGYLKESCIDKSCISEEVYWPYKEYITELKKNDGITFFSNHTGEKLKEMGFQENQLFKLPPLLPRPKEHSAPTSNQILFAGRIVPQKGLEYMLEAMSKVKNGDWAITIAGQGDRHYIKQLMKLAVSLHIDDKVAFVGHLPREELLKQYMKTKIMIFPSISHETYGFSGGEAISYGIPTVAFQIEGINEWLIDGYNGIMVPIMDTDAMAEAVNSLLTNCSLYEEFKSNCLEWSSKLAYEDQLKSMLQYYKSFLTIGDPV